jgi:hypothetical protein
MSVGTRNIKHWVRLLVVGLLLVSGQGCHHWGCYHWDHHHHHGHGRR